MKKVKHSFATIYNPMTNECFVDPEDIAKELAKSWGDIPKRINDTRAHELHLLGKAYLSAIKEIHRLRSY